MSRKVKSVDISKYPELVRLAENTREHGESWVLRRGDEELAVVVPLEPGYLEDSGRPRTTEDLEAFRSAAGSWRDEDTETFLKNNYESRQISRKPPVEL